MSSEVFQHLPTTLGPLLRAIRHVSSKLVLLELSDTPSMIGLLRVLLI